MSDNFLHDIDSAIAGDTKDTDIETITKDVTPEESATPQPKRDDNGISKLEDETLALLSSDEERKEEEAAKKKRETLTVKKEEPPQQKEKPQQQEQQQEQPQQQDDKKSKRQQAFLDRYLQENDRGDFITPSGHVIATSGESRAYVEGLKREGREYRDRYENSESENAILRQKFAEMHQDLQTAQKSPAHQSLAEQTGMDENEIRDAVNFMKAYKQNPLDGIKKILTSARTNGIDISSLGVHGGFDLPTIKQFIADAVQAQSQPPAKEPVDLKVSQEQNARELTRIMQNDADAEAILLGQDAESKRLQQAFIDGVSKHPNVPLSALWVQFKKELRNFESAKQQHKTRDVEDQQSATTNVKPQPRQRIAKPDVNKDFSTMSYDEIARSIMDEI